MNELLSEFLAVQSMPLLLAVLSAALLGLVGGSNRVVDAAVAVSRRHRLSKVFIGATVVSIGTTLPEAAISVFAAMHGQPGMALGNAVGSIICNSGLVLGIGAFLGAVTVARRTVRVQGAFLALALTALTVLSVSRHSPASIFSAGGQLSRSAGVFFILLLMVYMAVSLRLLKSGGAEAAVVDDYPSTGGAKRIAFFLLSGMLLVVFCSQLLVATVREMALRLHVPESVVAATIVAFGTSLPELATAIAAVRRNHGELAVGNVIGANILNVFFVVGAAAVVIPGGLAVPPRFFTMFFPVMILLHIILAGAMRGHRRLPRPAALLLLAVYTGFVIISYRG